MGKWICVDTGRERGRINNEVFGVLKSYFVLYSATR